MKKDIINIWDKSKEANSSTYRVNRGSNYEANATRTATNRNNDNTQTNTNYNIGSRLTL